MHHAEGVVAVDQVHPSNIKKKIVFWLLKKCTAIARGKAPPSQTYAMSLKIMNSNIICKVHANMKKVTHQQLWMDRWRVSGCTQYTKKNVVSDISTTSECM